MRVSRNNNVLVTLINTYISKKTVDTLLLENCIKVSPYEIQNAADTLTVIKINEPGASHILTKKRDFVCFWWNSLYVCLQKAGGW